MATCTAEQKEAIEYLQEWARAGFPRRVDGSFPPDFITAMRRLMLVPPEKVGYRKMEDALCAGPDFDYRLKRWRWGSFSVEDMKRRLA